LQLTPQERSDWLGGRGACGAKEGWVKGVGVGGGLPPLQRIPQHEKIPGHQHVFGDLGLLFDKNRGNARGKVCKMGVGLGENVLTGVVKFDIITRFASDF